MYSPTTNPKDARRAFRVALESITGLIDDHKVSLEKTIVEIRMHLDSLGIRRGIDIPATLIKESRENPESQLLGIKQLSFLLNVRKERNAENPKEAEREKLKDRERKQAVVSAWVDRTSIELPETPNRAAPDPRLAHPDPDEDSNPGEVWTPRFTYDDVKDKGKSTKKDWVRWSTGMWSKYTFFKKHDEKLGENLTCLLTWFDQLTKRKALNDDVLTPKKYTGDFNRNALNAVESVYKECRELRSKLHEALPAFEWRQ